MEECTQYLQVRSPLRMDSSGKPLQIPFQVVHSARRTKALQLREDGTLIIRLPRQMRQEEGLAFAREHLEWIQVNYQKIMERSEDRPIFSTEEIHSYMEQLRPVLKHRVDYYARIMGVNYGRITIRNQKTRWGSCSSQGNLNFNWHLVLLPAELLDYVVVHELAHRLEMNHSRRFWNQVGRILPDYETRRKRLRDYRY